MGNPEDLDIASALSERLSREADPVQVAEALDTIWIGIDAALSPILGKRGVAALTHRSLHVAGARHPWLAEQYDGVPVAFDIGALKAVVVRQSATDAVAGSALLVRAFCELLASLIGSSLTERLLRPLLAGPAREHIVPEPIA